MEIGPQLAFEVEEHVLLDGTVMVFLGDPQFKTFPKRWLHQKSRGINDTARVKDSNLGHPSGFPKLTLVAEGK